MIRRELERHGRWLIAIAVLVVLASLSALYIMSEQRVVTPLADRYTVRAEFETTSGLEPGLGQPVNVAGVRVGSITKAELREGRSLVSLEIDPDHLPRVYRDAQATLVPNTPLKDMTIELFPGHRRAGVLSKQGVIPVSQTAPPQDLDELLAVLDRDTRDYLQLLVSGLDTGTRGRGEDLRQIFRTLEPTARDLRAVGDGLAARRRELRRAVHNLSLLTRAAAGKDRELAQVVERAGATVSALAGQEAALRQATAKLPGTLGAAREVLRDREFTRELKPALDALLPVARRLPAALRAARPLVVEGEPLLRKQLRPLVRDAQPLVRDLAPASRDLSAVTPSLTGAFKVLRYLGNELAHNPAGPDEGYLFWLAWFSHNLNSSLSTEDALGAVFRGYDIFDCSATSQQPPFIELALLLAGANPTCS